jgi:polar amino acid transport system substrate-binding protein
VLEQTERMRKEIMRYPVFFLFLALATLAPAEEAPPKLKVGIFDCPPLAIKDTDGHWSGLSVELWEAVCEKEQIPFEYVETPLTAMIGSLVRGELDAGIGEIAISAERERLVDFTQAYLENEAAVALLKGARYPALGELIEELTQHGLFTILGIMFGALTFFSVILWLIERREGKGHFGGRPMHGLGSAIWFSAVTMTTVGYGDKTPQTGLGRLLAFLWMFFGILLVSAFTGTVASSLTVTRLNQSVSRLSDLARFHNGVLEGSVGQGVLASAGISAVAFPTIEEGLKALAEKRITAFVGDEASLRYLVNRDYSASLTVDKFPSTRVRFGVACRTGLPRFQDINVGVIELTGSDEWQGMLKRWIAAPGGP